MTPKLIDEAEELGMRREEDAPNGQAAQRVWEEDDGLEIESTSFRVVPEGSYLVTFMGFEKTWMPESTYMGKPTPARWRLRLRYKIIEGPEENVDLQEYCNATGGDRSILKARMLALRGGKPYGTDEKIRPAELKGQVARALVKVERITGNGETGTRNKIVSLSPYHPAAPQPDGAGPRPVRRVQAAPDEEPPAEAWGTAAPPLAEDEREGGEEAGR